MHTEWEGGGTLGGRGHPGIPPNPMNFHKFQLQYAVLEYRVMPGDSYRAEQSNTKGRKKWRGCLYVHISPSLALGVYIFLTTSQDSQNLGSSAPHKINYREKKLDIKKSIHTHYKMMTISKIGQQSRHWGVWYISTRDL